MIQAESKTQSSTPSKTGDSYSDDTDSKQPINNRKALEIPLPSDSTRNSLHNQSDHAESMQCINAHMVW